MTTDIDWGDPEEHTASAARLKPKTTLRAVPAPRPKVSAADREAKKAADAKVIAGRVRGATKQRKNWEASPQGQARTKNIVDLNADYREMDDASRDRGFKGPALSRTDYRAMKPHEVLRGLGVTNEGHGYGSQQLPGLENPHAAPTPPRWEDTSPAHQQRTKENMRLAGTSLEKMKNDFGAQFDQSVWEAHMAGHKRADIPDDTDPHGRPIPEHLRLPDRPGEPVPFSAHFYGEHPSDAPEPLYEPQKMLRESRQHLASKGIDIEPTVHTGVVSHVSPNTKFVQGGRGEATSPNIEAAESAIEQHAAGVPWHQGTSGKNRRGITNQARPANSRRAMKMLEHVEKGNPMGTSRNAPNPSNKLGSSQWGPKTGPFTNSFDTTTPDFLVGDVHTFGGGMLPHLGTSKPLAINKAGGHDRVKEYRNDSRSDEEIMSQEGRRAFRPDKSEREKGIETIGTAVPGSEGKKVTGHAAADYAARMAIQERGLGSSVRRPQATQWGEEQLQRKDVSPKMDLPTRDEAYPDQRPQINPNQFRMF